MMADLAEEVRSCEGKAEVLVERAQDADDPQQSSEAFMLQ
jgi:hypothetical protein